MFDFFTHSQMTAVADPSVMFLSSPFGGPREWVGISDYIGARGTCTAFSNPTEWKHAVETSADGVHAVVHGTAAYHALKLASETPSAFRSITLVDPDIINALPELQSCPQFYGHTKLIEESLEAEAMGEPIAAAAKVVNWWMGRKAWAQTSASPRSKLVAAMPHLAAEWRLQSRKPLTLLDLTTVSCPVQIVTGRHAPAEIRSLMRTLRMALPDFTTCLVKSAIGASHLTDPHIVAPTTTDFIVSSDNGWHNEFGLQAAA